MGKFRVGYWLPKVGRMEAKDSPYAKRLRLAFPSDPIDPGEKWMVQDHPGGLGCLAVWPAYDATGVTLEMFGAPRQTDDGMVYYPSLERPESSADLIRDEMRRPPGSFYTTALGESLYLALALASPRQLLLGRSGMKSGDYVTELGLLGHEVYDTFTSKDGISGEDPRVARLMFLALQAGYMVTEEMVEDGLPAMLTTQDVVPMLHKVCGTDPKPLADAPAPLPSAPGTSPTCP